MNQELTDLKSIRRKLMALIQVINKSDDITTGIVPYEIGKEAIKNIIQARMWLGNLIWIIETTIGTPDDAYSNSMDFSNDIIDPTSDEPTDDDVVQLLDGESFTDLNLAQKVKWIRTQVDGAYRDVDTISKMDKFSSTMELTTGEYEDPIGYISLLHVRSNLVQSRMWWGEVLRNIYEDNL